MVIYEFCVDGPYGAKNRVTSRVADHVEVSKIISNHTFYLA